METVFKMQFEKLDESKKIYGSTVIEVQFISVHLLYSSSKVQKWYSEIYLPHSKKTCLTISEGRFSGVGSQLEIADSVQITNSSKK